MSGRVLHVVKVAGISGAENHLLLLLPALAARGFDVAAVMLHEGEPGAEEFAARLEADGVPVERVRLARAIDPRAFARILGRARRERPAILHTHLVHADFHGLPAGRLARVPALVSTKHGFNAFRDGKAFAAADRTIASLADVHIAISAGLAGYLGESEGFDPASFEVVHYGIEAGPEPPPLPGAPRLAIVGRLIPIKGHDVLLRARRRGARADSRPDARDRRRGTARAGAPRDRRAARARRRRDLPRPGRARRTGARARRGRRRPVLRRGLRDGRARGDGARPSR